MNQRKRSNRPRSSDSSDDDLNVDSSIKDTASERKQSVQKEGEPASAANKGKQTRAAFRLPKSVKKEAKDEERSQAELFSDMDAMDRHRQESSPALSDSHIASSSTSPFKRPRIKSPS